MRIVLNVHPFEVTEEQQRWIASAAGGVDIEIVPPKCLNDVDPNDVVAMVTDDAPKCIERWKSLRLLQLSSAGFDHLESHPIWKHNVAVTTAGGIHAVPMAQYVLCVTLMMLRQIPEILAFHRTRSWEQRYDWYFQAELLRGKTAAILGYGAIGRETARLLQAFGMRIVCVNRTLRAGNPQRFCGWSGTGDPTGSLPEEWHGIENLDDVLSQSDLVVVSLPSTPETKGLIDWKRLRLMKPSARIVIVSRGGIVEEAALARALQEGIIAGAAVDCFEEEPLPPTHFLFESPNLILTPHISGGFQGYWPKLCELFCQNLQRLRTAEPLLNLVE